tara:strand:- start:4621 stop:5649 length:1029 start_codon:yes stop_codon:yes gene_type:complete
MKLKLGLAILFSIGLFFEIYRDFINPPTRYTEESGKSSHSPQSFSPLSEPMELNKPKALLGRDLFSDTRLSKGNQISCKSCHNLENGGADNAQFSAGVGNSRGIINTPSVFNSSLNFKQFWNGRADDLNSQIDGPIHNPLAMSSDWPEIISKLKADPNYVSQFKKVFDQEITKNTIIESIVEFEKALITIDAPFDLYLKGDRSAMTEAQHRGFTKFQEYGCIACHQGQNLGGNMFQNMGVAFDYFAERGGSYESDQGRFAITKLYPDLHVFKVPSLRNVELTAPYFHDGTEPSLENAVKKMGRYQLGRDLPKEDVKDIANFLKALTGKKPKILREANNANEK